MACPKFLMGELGVMAKCLASLFMLAAWSCTTYSEQRQPTQTTCTTGSLEQLHVFFLEQDYLLIAQGVSSQQTEIFFMVSSDMDYFHIVNLVSLASNQWQACIASSAREIDYQHLPPVPGVLTRIDRAHTVFSDDIPSHQKCPPENTTCRPWSPAVLNSPRRLILTGYEYSASDEPDGYAEPVELKIDQHYIYPARGELAELARTKYALRMTEQLQESDQDAASAKKVYREMYLNVDHQLALIIFSADNNQNWLIEKIDRTTGLIWTLNMGTALQMYPLSYDDYLDFSSAQNQQNK